MGRALSDGGLCVCGGDGTWVGSNMIFLLCILLLLLQHMNLIFCVCIYTLLVVIIILLF